MKVVYLSDYPCSIAYGGKEVQMEGYRTALTAQGRGWDVRQLDYWDRRGLEDAGIVHLFGHSAWFLQIVKAARANNPQVRFVVSPTYYTERPAREALAGRLLRRLPMETYYSMRRRLFEAVDLIVVNSEAEKQQLLTIFHPGVASKVAVVMNAIEDDYASLDESDRGRFCDAHGVEPGYVLSVGFLDERKNTERLVTAFLEHHAALGRRLVLVGGYRFSDGPTRQRVQALIEGNPGPILHIPFLDRASVELRSAYAACHAHALPSRVETPGLSNIEALAFGKPLLVGDCPPVREYFKDVAVFCDPRSTADVGRALRAMCDAPSTSARAEEVAKRYTWRVMAERLDGLYRSLMTPTPSV